MRNRPVVFMEHNLAGDASLSGNRRNRWYQATGVSSATKPLVMTDSGFRYLQGSQSDGFDTAYRRIVDQSLREEPLVAIEAWQERIGIQSALRVHGRITNIGSLVLGYDNSATVNVIVYETTKVANVNQSVRRAVAVELDPDLAPGEVREFSIDVEDLGRTNMNRAQAVVLLDYKPGGDHKAYVSANAALASKDAPPPTEQPTDPPTPTDVPTQAPSPTVEEPTPAPTDPATPTPTPSPTNDEPVEGSTIFLPLAKNAG